MIEQNLDDKIISDVTRKRNRDDVFHESEYGMKISDYCNMYFLLVGVKHAS
ncbi:MAG: hypothetical protein HZA82_04740 [Thaumarchaeota archaeon]|nr:hypothetical protein [Nitrososphaerota archaeon]